MPEDSSPRTWERLGDRLWMASYRVSGFACRSLAFQTVDGAFCVYGPGLGLAASFQRELGEQGPLRWLIAPNSYHHLGIPGWREAFADAKVAAAARAVPRLAKKGITEVHGLEEVRAELPAGVALHEAPASRIGELWLEVAHEGARVLAVCDAFFNFRPARKFGAKLLQRLMKSGPGPAVSNLYKWGAVADRAAHTAWLRETLRAIQPTVVVPQHGDLLRQDAVAETLIALIDARY